MWDPCAILVKGYSHWNHFTVWIYIIVSWYHSATHTQIFSHTLTILWYYYTMNDQLKMFECLYIRSVENKILVTCNPNKYITNAFQMILRKQVKVHWSEFGCYGCVSTLLDCMLLVWMCVSKNTQLRWVSECFYLQEASSISSFCHHYSLCLSLYQEGIHTVTLMKQLVQWCKGVPYYIIYCGWKFWISGCLPN